MKRGITIFLIVIMMMLYASSFSKGEHSDVFAASKMPSKVITHNGHSYKFYDKKGLNWEEAEEFCESRGGHLVTITSKTENRFLLKRCNKKRNPKHCYWIGLYRNEGGNDWQWITDEVFSFENWASGEPNNYNTDETYAEYYGQTSGGYEAGYWNDILVDGDNVSTSWHKLEDTGFICEWDYVK